MGPKSPLSPEATLLQEMMHVANARSNMAAPPPPPPGLEAEMAAPDTLLPPPGMSASVNSSDSTSSETKAMDVPSPPHSPPESESDSEIEGEPSQKTLETPRATLDLSSQPSPLPPDSANTSDEDTADSSRRSSFVSEIGENQNDNVQEEEDIFNVPPPPPLDSASGSRPSSASSQASTPAPSPPSQPSQIEMLSPPSPLDLENLSPAQDQAVSSEEDIPSPPSSPDTFGEYDLSFPTPGMHILPSLREEDEEQVDDDDDDDDDEEEDVDEEKAAVNNQSDPGSDGAEKRDELGSPAGPPESPSESKLNPQDHDREASATRTSSTALEPATRQSTSTNADQGVEALPLSEVETATNRESIAEPPSLDMEVGAPPLPPRALSALTLVLNNNEGDDDDDDDDDGYLDPHTPEDSPPDEPASPRDPPSDPLPEQRLGEQVAVRPASRQQSRVQNPEEQAHPETDSLSSGDMGPPPSHSPPKLGKVWTRCSRLVTQSVASNKEGLRSQRLQMQTQRLAHKAWSSFWDEGDRYNDENALSRARMALLRGEQVEEGKGNEDRENDDEFEAAWRAVARRRSRRAPLEVFGDSGVLSEMQGVQDAMSELLRPLVLGTEVCIRTGGKSQSWERCTMWVNETLENLCWARTEVSSPRRRRLTLLATCSVRLGSVDCINAGGHDSPVKLCAKQYTLRFGKKWQNGDRENKKEDVLAVELAPLEDSPVSKEDWLLALSLAWNLAASRY
ncbi:Hypothetical Protein FCC1311_086042 [Hondaea fermentalgiana]|uniref:PH domain-containing protein n=1 Tax=Hondaea fermentalgiana TaxID=2315210 RepID=A0A2R5GPZ9_9STRA|nr:Hypothetical Protein FCC1311_086042 [Hondaea fermentalgiana]|eukprot:GBG32379.1 Hypothetical Protein FCC1311_086042 [Hondaea fermentalgiana]